MKKAVALLAGVVMLGVLSGCALLLGPDEPVGKDGGNLSITFGAAGNSGNQRAISSGEELPDAMLAALRYELTLTGPGGETLEQTVSGGENLKLTVSLGEWRIEARAYQGAVLAGSGELTHQVAPGINAIQVPMKINEGYFAISIQADNGTIEADFSDAFPDTTVTLTVTPDPGYALKSRSLAYNDGNEDHAITANEQGSYTFAMPAADITIHADFNKVIGFAIEGPRDEMIAVSVEPDDTVISWSGEGVVTFTVEDSRYSVEKENLKWMVNGSEIPDAGGRSLVIDARSWMPRVYVLTVMIKENDRWYSGEYSFTVAK